ncbi:TPA: hypothetical protein DCX16_02865 [bacterium]|nr:hypothetical protein [bacterium]
MEEKIKKVIEEDISPILASHGGGCEFVGLSSDGIVKIRLTGLCSGCPGARASIKGIVEEILMSKVNKIKGVEGVF